MSNPRGCFDLNKHNKGNIGRPPKNCYSSGNEIRKPPTKKPPTFKYFRKEGNKYLLCPRLLNSYYLTIPPSRRGSSGWLEIPSETYLMSLREKLNMDLLKQLGLPINIGRNDIETSVLAAASISGLVTNMAFLDIIDNNLVRVACLCCCYTKSKKQAIKVEDQIGTLIKYYSQESYIKSTLFQRNICNLLRDITQREALMIKNHLHKGLKDIEIDTIDLKLARKLHHLTKTRTICAVYSPHPLGQPHSSNQMPIIKEKSLLYLVFNREIWFYSSRDVRRFFRRFSRKCKKNNLTIAIKIISDPISLFSLRFKRRLYSIKCFPKDGTDLSTVSVLFWDTLANKSVTRKSVENST